MVSESAPVGSVHGWGLGEMAIKTENTKNGKAFFVEEYGAYISYLH